MKKDEDIKNTESSLVEIDELPIEIDDACPTNIPSQALADLCCIRDENYTSCSSNFDLISHIDSLNESINSLNQNYIGQTSNLIDTVSTIPDGSYLLEITAGITGAFVAAFAVFLFNSIYFKNINAINKKAHFAKTALKLIEYFEETSTEYWISERIKDERRKNVNNKEMKLLEIKIKSEFSVMRISLENFCELLSQKEASDISEIKSVIDRLYELATGGEFESVDKKSNIKVTKEIAKLCTNLKSLLLQHSHQVN